ncbi:hypothetical protein ACFX12_024899 [Malus domestica]
MRVFPGQFQAFPTFFGSSEDAYFVDNKSGAHKKSTIPQSSLCAVYRVLVIEALATYVGQVVVPSLIALFVAATTAMNVEPLCEFSYECFVNVEDLIKLNDVMVEHSLGPNGGDNLEKLDGRNNGY